MKGREYIIQFADRKNWRLTEEEVSALVMCRMYVLSQHPTVTKDLIVRELRSIDASAALIEKLEEWYVGSIIEATLRNAMDQLISQVDLGLGTDT